jgi:hypothetical protein
VFRGRFGTHEGMRAIQIVEKIHTNPENR